MRTDKTCWISCRASSTSRSSTSTATARGADGIASSRPCVSTRGSACFESGEAERLRDRHLAFFHELVRRAEPELTQGRSGRRGSIGCIGNTTTCGLAARVVPGGAGTWRAEPGTRRGAVLVLDEARLLPRRTGVAGARAVGRRRRAARRSGPGRSCFSGSLTFFQGDLRPHASAGGRKRHARPDRGRSLRRRRSRSASARSRRWSAATSPSAHDSPPRGRRRRVRAPTPWMQGPALACLAYLAMHEGDFDRAGRLHEEVLEWSRRQGEKWAMGITLFDLALLRVVQQRHAEARALCAEGIVLYQEFGDRLGIAWCLGILSGSRGRGGTSSPRGPAPRRHGGSARERRRTRSSQLQAMDRRSLPRRDEGSSRRERCFARHWPKGAPCRSREPSSSASSIVKGPPSSAFAPENRGSPLRPIPPAPAFS